MAYQVVHSPLVPRGQPEPPSVTATDYPTRDLALEAAFKLIEHQQIVWRIEGPDGYRMPRRDLDIHYNDKTGNWPPR
jgi:hypothetical protein